MKDEFGGEYIKGLYVPSEEHMCEFFKSKKNLKKLEVTETMVNEALEKFVKWAEEEYETLQQSDKEDAPFKYLENNDITDYIEDDLIPRTLKLTQNSSFSYIKFRLLNLVKLPSLYEFQDLLKERSIQYIRIGRPNS